MVPVRRTSIAGWQVISVARSDFDAKQNCGSAFMI